FRDRGGWVSLWRFLRPLIYGQPASDKAWIAEHYDFDADFFRLFLDRRHRCYSQGIFASDGEPPEDAMTRKLDLPVAAAGIKPGGAIYLDASASRKRYDLSTFFIRRIFPGNGTLLCLHDYLTAVAATPFEVVGVWNDRHNYELTIRQWARNLDANADEIERRWGRALYRTFRLYLWGCADGFSRDMITAYRWVLR